MALSLLFSLTPMVCAHLVDRIIKDFYILATAMLCCFIDDFTLNTEMKIHS